MAERRPWSAFYWRDWLSDPAVRGSLSREERGPYMDVLAYTNQTDTPGVMTEDQCRGWAGYSVEEWPEHREAFSRCFKIRGKKWIQKRTVLEAAAAEKIAKRLSNGGKKGARARWADAGTSVAPSSEPHSDRNGPSIASTQSHTQTQAQESESKPSSVTSSVLESNGSALASVPRARRARPRARAAQQVVPISPEHVRKAAERFALPIETVRLIAERITLEAEDRGYRVLPSALLNWCKREVESPDHKPGHRKSRGLSVAEILAIGERMKEADNAKG